MIYSIYCVNAIDGSSPKSGSIKYAFDNKFFEKREDAEDFKTYLEKCKGYENLKVDFIDVYSTQDLYINTDHCDDDVVRIIGYFNSILDPIDKVKSVQIIDPDDYMKYRLGVDTDDHHVVFDMKCKEKETKYSFYVRAMAKAQELYDEYYNRLNDAIDKSKEYKKRLVKEIYNMFRKAY